MHVAAITRERTTTVATRSSFFSFFLREAERSLLLFFSFLVASALSDAPSVPVPGVAPGSGEVARLAGVALRRCAKGHPFPLVHAPFGKKRQGAGWSYSLFLGVTTFAAEIILADSAAITRGL